MKLQEQFQNDLKAAMIKRDSELMSFLRVILGEINQKGKDVSDEVSTKILKTMRSNAELMNNPYEIEVIDRYLPAMFTEDQIREVVVKILNDNKLVTIKDMGKAMGFIKSSEFASRIDGTISSKIVKEILSVVQ